MKAADPGAARHGTMLRLWLPVLLWMAAIFVLSAQPALPRAPDDLIDTLLKKGAHLGEYLVLAFLLGRALAADGLRQMQFVAFGIAVAYAISDEVHQGLV